MQKYNSKFKSIKIFAFLIAIFNFYFLIFNLDNVLAADYIFGTDAATGDFTIREKGGSIKLRIDSSGNLDAPIKGLSAGGENLLPNGSFESDVDGDGIPNNWSKNFQTVCANCSYSLDDTNTNVRDGVKSLTIVTSGSAPNTDTVTIASDPFPVTPGKTYTASLDVKGNFGSGFSLKVLYYQSSGTTSFADADSSDTAAIKNNLATTDSWASYSGDFTVPVSCGAANNLGCTRARLMIVHLPGSATSARYFDNAKVAVAQSISPVNASNVSAGFFGSNTGGGVFSFPGNVGIGTALPLAKLDIAGVTSTITNTSGDINIVPAANLILTQGNFGIGTTGPIHKIDINGAIKLGDEGTKPACNSAHRGTLFPTFGGTGVKDSLELCAKDAADAYAWRVIY